MSINHDEWLAALQEVQPVDDQEALTSTELGVLFGLKASATKSRLNKMVADGLALVVRKRGQDSAGRTQWFPAYRLIKKVTDHVPNRTPLQTPGARRRGHSRSRAGA